MDEAYDSTDETGATTMQTESFDYRFYNLCNFSCRMCGDMLSSSWEAESERHRNMETTRITGSWGRNDIKRTIRKFQDQQVVKEFTTAVEDKKDNRNILVRWRTFDVEDTLEGHAEDNRTRIRKRSVGRYNSNMSRIII